MEADSPGPRASLWFFLFALAVFLATRLYELDRFPIYFFCDEAVQTVQASRLVSNGLRDENGTLLPTYFRNTEFYNLSIGVYLQALPERFIGRSVFLTRATQVLVIFSAMVAVGLMLRDFFRLRFWWVGVLLLCAFPGWFLHNRIAFELNLAAACYVWFLYFYLRYRSGRPRAVFPALLFGALTFYGYNTFQPVIVATALLLAAADAPYHWKNRRTLVWAIPFLLLLVLPYVRYLRAHPAETAERLRALDSYWTDPNLTLPGKVRTYGAEYLRGFSPRYWFFPEPPGDIGRHIMKGYPHIPLAVLPLAVGGIVLCARRIRAPAERALLVALAAAPVGAAIVRPGITRAMTLVVVIGMLAAIAADALLRLASRVVAPLLVATLAALGLAAGSAAMLADALRNGPTWYRDYGLYGMQWGSRQVFDAVGRYRERFPDALILVTPVWANGIDDLLEFFLPGSERVLMANVDWLLYQRRNIAPNTVAIMVETEYRRALEDPRFADVRLEETIPYPDGTPGFRVVRLGYSDKFDAILAAEQESWRRLRDEDVEIGGELARVSHSLFDVGEVQALFDGDPRTLARTERANPAVLVVEFPTPRPLRGLRLTTGSLEYELTLTREGPSGSANSRMTYRNLPADPTVEVALPGQGAVSRVRIEVRDINSSEPFPVHLREVEFF